MSFRKSYQFNVSPLLIITKLVIVLLFSSGLTIAEPVSRNTRKSGLVSIQEYETIGVVYADAMNNKDIQKLVKFFDMKGFAYTTARTVFDSKRDIDTYVKGFLRNTEEKFLRHVFSPIFKQEVKVKFLRVLNGNQPLIRIDYQTGGHEYAVLDIKRTADNKLTVVDMFLLSSGKKLSVTIGAASQLMIRPSKSMLRRLFGKVDVDADMVRSFRELINYKKNEKYKEAYDLIESFPDELKNERVMIDMSIQLSQFINEDEYRKQLSRLDKYYGKDETTTFILIDHYYFTKNYNKAQLSIDRLIDRFGVDGALLNLKANTYHIANNNINAQAYARKAIKLEPLFEDAYWTLATVLTTDEDYDELVKVLNVIEKKFSYTFTAEDFTGSSFYKEFVKTSEFKARFK